MPLRFRKSVKLFPGFKINFGKKSVGVSTGGRFGGLSFNSRAGARMRVSLPGTGLSYTKKLNPKQPRQTADSAPPEKPFYRRWWFYLAIFLLALALLTSCGKDSDAPAGPVSSSAPSPSPSASVAAAYERPKSTPRVLDYVLNNSSRKFHATSCDSVPKIKESNREDFTGTREELIERGYDACAICKP